MVTKYKDLFVLLFLPDVQYTFFISWNQGRTNHNLYWTRYNINTDEANNKILHKCWKYLIPVNKIIRDCSILLLTEIIIFVFEYITPNNTSKRRVVVFLIYFIDFNFKTFIGFLNYRENNSTFFNNLQKSCVCFLNRILRFLWIYVQRANIKIIFKSLMENCNL